MTTICASLLAWRLKSPAIVSTAYGWAFLFLCALHALTFLVTLRQPNRLDEVSAPEG